MQQWTDINRDTRLVLGDWVRGIIGNKPGLYRLGAFITVSKQWVLWRDGVNPARGVDRSTSMRHMDLLRYGFERAGEHQGWEHDQEPVYLYMHPDPKLSHQRAAVAIGTDPFAK